MRIQRVMMSADTVGGVWSYALELAQGLSDRGIDVLLATLGRLPLPSQRRDASRIRGLALECSEYPLEWMPGAMPAQQQAGGWLLALARRWLPDVVHLNHYVHGHLPWPAPSLVVAHSCVLSWFHHVRGQPAGADWESYRQAVRGGLRATAMVVAPTRAMLVDVQNLYGPLTAVRVIHNGRRADEFVPLQKLPQVLAAGRLWDDAKNIRALRYAALTLPWPVCVAGETRRPRDGEDDGVADIDAIKGMQPLGVLGREAMAKALGEASIYVLPALYEPFGLSALEAACAGCALVLGDIDSLRELWDGAAEFAPPTDPMAIRDAIARLVVDPHLREMRARQARMRAQRYTARHMVDSYLDAYAVLTRPQECLPCVL